ncbi:hypothetical protein QBC35DRAFT_475483 [Podospora australis]|uniref:Uncharacterized protein n=1 Tax=Podospora australis TaxID=1536484 RepID=A0AAN6WRF9_9PEZI|nr:hypothetical protein QBC35DRAFT_475483 [Podospora australis]
MAFSRKKPPRGRIITRAPRVKTEKNPRRSRRQEHPVKTPKEAKKVKPPRETKNRRPPKPTTSEREDPTPPIRGTEDYRHHSSSLNLQAKPETNSHHIGRRPLSSPPPRETENHRHLSTTTNPQARHQTIPDGSRREGHPIESFRETNDHDRHPNATTNPQVRPQTILDRSRREEYPNEPFGQADDHRHPAPTASPRVKCETTSQDSRSPPPPIPPPKEPLREPLRETEDHRQPGAAHNPQVEPTPIPHDVGRQQPPIPPPSRTENLHHPVPTTGLRVESTQIPHHVRRPPPPPRTPSEIEYPYPPSPTTTTGPGVYPETTPHNTQHPPPPPPPSRLTEYDRYPSPTTAGSTGFRPETAPYQVPRPPPPPPPPRAAETHPFPDPTTTGSSPRGVEPELAPHHVRRPAPPSGPESLHPPGSTTDLLRVEPIPADPHHSSRRPPPPPPPPRSGLAHHAKDLFRPRPRRPLRGYFRRHRTNHSVFNLIRNTLSPDLFHRVCGRTGEARWYKIERRWDYQRLYRILTHVIYERDRFTHAIWYLDATRMRSFDEYLYHVENLLRLEYSEGKQRHTVGLCHAYLRGLRNVRDRACVEFLEDQAYRREVAPGTIVGLIRDKGLEMERGIWQGRRRVQRRAANIQQPEHLEYLLFRLRRLKYPNPAAHKYQKQRARGLGGLGHRKKVSDRDLAVTSNLLYDGTDADPPHLPSHRTIVREV